MGGLAKREDPDLANRLRFKPEADTYVATLTAARGLYGEALAHKEVLAKHGLSESVLERFGQLLEEFDAAVALCGEGRAKHLGATKKLAALAVEAGRIVRAMDARSRHRWRNDPQRLGVWIAASTVLGRPAGLGNGDSPAPAPLCWWSSRALLACPAQSGGVMSTAAIPATDATADARAGQVDLRLEVVTIPVADLDRAKAFYEGLGWRLDADFVDGTQRAIQFTPPGSPASIHFTVSGTPGSARGLFLVVSDIEAARDELRRRGVLVSEVFHPAGPGPLGGAVNGLAPGRQSYASLATFGDPDGNGWILQEVTTRLPGRVAGDTTYGSVAALAQAMRRASEAHGRHEERTGQRDENWPDWYAAYMVAEQAGSEVPT